MLAFAPMKDAHVSSGRKTYSSGHPMAPAYDCNIALVGVVKCAMSILLDQMTTALRHV